MNALSNSRSSRSLTASKRAAWSAPTKTNSRSGSWRPRPVKTVPAARSTAELRLLSVSTADAHRMRSIVAARLEVVRWGFDLQLLLGAGDPFAHLCVLQPLPYVRL